MIRGFLFLFVALFVFSACQSFDNAEQGRNVSLVSVDVTQAGFDRTELAVSLNIQNPGHSPLPMPSIEWGLIVDGERFISGTQSLTGTIGRRRAAHVSIPVSFAFKDFYNQFAHLFPVKEVPYHIELSINFKHSDKGIEPEIFEVSGILIPPQLPLLHLGDKRIVSYDFSAIQLSWDVEVENPNTFPIPFPTLIWVYHINDAIVSSGSFGYRAIIPPTSRYKTLVSINMPYEDILRSLGNEFNAYQAHGVFSIAVSREDMGFPQLELQDDHFAMPSNNAVSAPLAIPVLRPPEVFFTGITRRSLGMLRFEFELGWEVHNRNNFGFEVGEFNYEFTVNNRAWTQSSLGNTPRIAANGRTAISTNVVITAPVIVQELVTVLSQGSNVAYDNRGNVTFIADSEGLGKLDIPLQIMGSTRIR